MRRLLITSLLLFAMILLAACGGADDATDAPETDDSADTEDAVETDDAEAEESTDGGGGVLAEIQESGTVTVGFANEKPYAYEEDGELKGAAVDIATAVFAELGVDNVEGHLADFGQLIPGLNAKHFDVITAGMAITPERCENAAFGEPEMIYGEGIIVQAGNPKEIYSYKDIAADPDITVSIMAGATENEFVQQEGVDPSQIQSAPDIPATLSAVESGRADVTTGTSMTLLEAFESLGSDDIEFVMDFEQPDIEGIPSYGAAAFHEDADDLREAYNEALAELKDTDLYGELLEANFFSLESNGVGNDITAEEVCSGEIYQQ